MLEWEGRRLIKYNNKYTYNEKGIRIKKELPNDVTDIYVSGTKVIGTKRVKDNQITITSFNYDSTDSLVSLTIDNIEYFYVRDITGHINSIIDKDAKTMVEYTYDGYGNPSIVNVANNSYSSLIINNNPFIYKGYYYDGETSYYFCNSRYYDPQIGRWISADDIQYLEPSSINGLNLYSYCQNNPIMYSEDSAIYGKGKTIVGKPKNL